MTPASGDKQSQLNAERIENLFSFLYVDDEFYRPFLDQVKEAALRGCAPSATAPTLRERAIEVFVKTCAGPAFGRDDIRAEAKAIIEGKSIYAPSHVEKQACTYPRCSYTLGGPAVQGTLCRPDCEIPTARPSIPATKPEVRLNEDGTLDEVCGHGAHLEQLDDDHWFLSVFNEHNEVAVWLHAKGKITASYELRSTPSNGAATGETPRTDALYAGIKARSKARGFPMPEDIDDGEEHAAQLERELATLREKYAYTVQRAADLDCAARSSTPKPIKECHDGQPCSNMPSGQCWGRCLRATYGVSNLTDKAAKESDMTLLGVLTRLQASATPTENYSHALVPAAMWREFVDAHAAALYTEANQSAKATPGNAALADKIEQTVNGTQFEPFLSDMEWAFIVQALRSNDS